MREDPNYMSLGHESESGGPTRNEEAAGEMNTTGSQGNLHGNEKSTWRRTGGDVEWGGGGCLEGWRGS